MDVVIAAIIVTGSFGFIVAKLSKLKIKFKINKKSNDNWSNLYHW